jgi:hypothetical protein
MPARTVAKLLLVIPIIHQGNARLDFFPPDFRAAVSRFGHCVTIGKLGRQFFPMLKKVE